MKKIKELAILGLLLFPNIINAANQQTQSSSPLNMTNMLSVLITGFTAVTDYFKESNSLNEKTRYMLSEFIMGAHDQNKKSIVDTNGYPMSLFQIEMKKWFGMSVKKDDLSFLKQCADIASINEKTNSSLNKQLLDILSYNTNKNLEDINISKAALLTQPLENKKNNIINDVTRDASNLNVLGFSISKVNEAKNSYYAQFGSIYYTKSPETQYTKSEINNTEALNIDSLLGPNVYSEKELNNARLFLNQLLQIAPLPDTFSIPNYEKITDPYGNFRPNTYEDKNTVKLYIPYPSTDGKAPYSTVYVKTSQGSCGGSSNKACSEYDEMVKYLNSNTLFQQYKMLYRSKIALRTVYLDSLMRSLQERTKQSGQGKSLVEQENEMALSGVSTKYYDDLMSSGSAARLNIETLYTLNKIVYFLHKLNQRTEHSEIMTAVIGLQNQLQSMMDKNEYIDPINKLIINKCWDTKLEPAAGGISDATERQKICQNPRSGGGIPTQLQ